MKQLGYEINEDGIIQYRNNGGIIERKFLYAYTPVWETVGGLERPFDLKKHCQKYGWGFCKTLKEAKFLFDSFEIEKKTENTIDEAMLGSYCATEDGRIINKLWLSNNSCC